MSELTNPHDRFFKETFSRPELARDFLQNYLPAELVAIIDFDSLQLQKDSYIAPDLQEYFSDLVYLAHSRDNEELTFYLLLEHKSYQDWLTPLQLLRYMVEQWWQDVRQRKKKLRPIIPLVLYQGREGWRIGTTFGPPANAPAAFWGYWPAFNYLLVDLNQFDDVEIRGVVLTKITMLLMKHIMSDQLGETLVGFVQLLKQLADAETGLQYLELLLRYVSSANERITEDDLNQIIHLALGNKGDKIMTTLAEKWIQQGLQQGVQQGLQQGVQQGLQQGVQQGLQQGVQEGLQQGVQQGVQQGMGHGLVRGIERVLARRFDWYPAGGLQEQLADKTRPELEAILDNAILAPDLETFLSLLNQP